MDAQGHLAADAESEQWCDRNNVPATRVPRAEVPTPDFTIRLNGVEIVCEVKQINPNAADRADLDSESTEGRFVPNRLREKLGDISRQLKAASLAGNPTPAVVCDKTVFRTYCEHADVIQAMLGDDTVRVDVRTSKVVRNFLGANKRFTATHNTSVSALAVLEPTADSELQLRVYHNPYARVILDPALFLGLRVVTGLAVGATSVRLY